MGFFQSLSIRAKLLISFLMVLLLNIVVIGISIFTSSTTLDSVGIMDDVLNKAYVRVSTSQQALSAGNDLIIAWLNPKNKELTEDKFYIKYQSLKSQALSAAEHLIPDYMGTQEYRDLINGVKKGVSDCFKLVDSNIIAQVRAGKHTEALIDYTNIVSPKYQETQGYYTKLFRIQMDKVLAEGNRATDKSGLYLSIILGIINIVIGIFLALIISNYISKHLAGQIQTLDKISHGDLTVELHSIGQKDEFGYAARAIKRMVDSLHNAVSLTVEECNRLQENLKTIQSDSHKIVEQSSQTESQSVTVAAAADEMVSTTADIAKNCESAATSSEDSKRITSEGVDKVHHAVAMIHSQSKITKDNAAKIDNLAKQTTEIGSIVSTIEDIAAQTNLLALNAAIEAARAGDAGRGFAVVADEVRALASRTSKSTQEISKMVGHIQNEAAVATDAISSSVTSMEEVATEASQIEQVLDEITNQVNKVNSQITQIATAAEEQTTATSEISSNMQSITTSSQKIASSANVSNSSINDMQKDIDNLKNELAFFKL